MAVTDYKNHNADDLHEAASRACHDDLHQWPRQVTPPAGFKPIPRIQPLRTELRRGQVDRAAGR